MYQGRFGLVFLFQVMEHMDDLEGLFECLRLVTKPGARIFISVPDIRHTRWTETHGGLLDMPPNHTSRWTPASLLALARRMRLEVVDIESRPWRLRDFLAAGTYSAYARRMQYAGSIPNRLHRPPRGILRSALEGAVAACFARSRLRYLPAVRARRCPVAGAKEVEFLRVIRCPAWLAIARWRRNTPRTYPEPKESRWLRYRCGFSGGWRRGRDSNPRDPAKGLTVFETAPIDHSGTSPYPGCPIISAE
jgi:SAM-dependent methyltransferase